jgi:NAD(P)-dependent dehydrogenase (short-subunit alcohol dehydrogenase family)
LAKDGALVAVHYGHNTEAANRTVGEIEASGGAAFALQADLSSVTQIEQLYQALDAELAQRTQSNHFDILVNNAGLSATIPYTQMSAAEFDQLFAVNVRGPFFMVQAALSRLREGGRIINISSATSRHAARPIVVAYGMSKAALDAFTVSLAADLGRRGITANTIGPGAIETEMNAEILNKPEARQAAISMTPLGRIGNVTDIANIAAFLASEEGGWVTGQYIAATGGMGL